MKNVLSQLHNIINELEESNLIKEASTLNNLFVKLSDASANKSMIIPMTKDDDGEPNLAVKEYSLGRPNIDNVIHKSLEYQKLRNDWLNKRQTYLNAKKFSQNSAKTQQLARNWADAETTLGEWYIGAFQQVKAGKAVPKINKLQLDDVTDEKTKSVKPKTKLVSKPVEKSIVKPSVSKPINKPVVPKPEAKPKQQLKEQVQPIQNELTNDQIYFKAQMAFVDYQAKQEELGSKVKAYNVMQAEVYNSDKTKGKQIYKQWEKLVNLDNDENEK